jgi:hypothetical protein
VVFVSIIIVGLHCFFLHCAVNVGGCLSLLFHYEVLRFPFLLGEFATLQKAVISLFVSVHRHETARLPLKGFAWNLKFEDKSDFCRGHENLIKV